MCGSSGWSPALPIFLSFFYILSQPTGKQGIAHFSIRVFYYVTATAPTGDIYPKFYSNNLSFLLGISPNCHLSFLIHHLKPYLLQNCLEKWKGIQIKQLSPLKFKVKCIVEKQVQEGINLETVWCNGKFQDSGLRWSCPLLTVWPQTNHLI